MLKITIISLGNLKEKYWLLAEKEYLKRLQKFCYLEIIELKEEKFKSSTELTTILKKESEKILKILNKFKQYFLISLDQNGQQLNNSELSQKITTITNQYSHIIIVIGGPLGLSEKIKNKANLILSLSNLTFTHQMVRIILLEQIYRSFKIINNEKYHY